MASILTEDPAVARRAAKRHRRAWHVFAALEFSAKRHRVRVGPGPGGVVRVTGPEQSNAILFGRTMWTHHRTLAIAYAGVVADANALPRRVSWSEVPPGSAWVDADGDVGLRWPKLWAGLDCGWTQRSFVHDTGGDYPSHKGLLGMVELVAVDLTEDDCDRLAKTDQDKRVALARRLSAARAKRGAS